jgi:hypothetical protein
MIKILLRSGADPDQQPDSDICDYLPFVCHSLFLKELSARHKGGAYTRTQILDRSIAHRLNVGDAKRLIHLINLGLLDRATVQSYICDYPMVIEEKLQVMIRYLTYYFNVRIGAGTGTEVNFTKETKRVVEKFRTVVEFLIKYGAPVTEKAITLCIDHYLHEILLVFLPESGQLPVTGISEPLYHTQMNSTKVAMLRPLLNDERYVKICSVTGHKPDPEVFNYNLMS